MSPSTTTTTVIISSLPASAGISRFQFFARRSGARFFRSVLLSAFVAIRIPPVVGRHVIRIVRSGVTIPSILASCARNGTASSSAKSGQTPTRSARVSGKNRS